VKYGNVNYEIKNKWENILILTDVAEEGLDNRTITNSLIADVVMLSKIDSFEDDFCRKSLPLMYFGLHFPPT
jgi:hypothetical protein